MVVRHRRAHLAQHDATAPAALQADGFSFNINLIVGGQIAGQGPEIHYVYPQGNFIEASGDTNYLQIGETKYGKPIIDRVVKFLPIDLLGYEKDRLRVTLKRRFAEGDPFFTQLSSYWSSSLRRVFVEAPDVSWT